MSEFYKYFKQNMDALYLPRPENTFGTVPWYRYHGIYDANAIARGMYRYQALMI